MGIVQWFVRVFVMQNVWIQACPRSESGDLRYIGELRDSCQTPLIKPRDLKVNSLCQQTALQVPEVLATARE
jgi:hypothetical protein